MCDCVAHLFFIYVIFDDSTAQMYQYMNFLALAGDGFKFKVFFYILNATYIWHCSVKTTLNYLY